MRNVDTQPRSRIRRRRKMRRLACGFTLVELTVASLLAVILLWTIVGVFRSVWRQDQHTRRIAARNPQTRLLEAQLRRDLINARAIAIAPGSIRLAGFLSTSRATRLPVWRRAEVRYQIGGSPARPLLMRREVGLDDPSDRRDSEIVWIGAAALEVATSELAREPLPGAENVAGGMRPMPRQLRVTVRDAQGNSICSESVVHY